MLGLVELVFVLFLLLVPRGSFDARMTFLSLNLGSEVAIAAAHLLSIVCVALGHVTQDLQMTERFSAKRVVSSAQKTQSFLHRPRGILRTRMNGGKIVRKRNFVMMISMGLQRKVALALLLIAASFGAAAPLRAAPCSGSSRYVMPPGVETGSATPGVAPADLPGSRSGYMVPPKIAFDLSLNPVGPAFDESRLPLGRVKIDRKTGQTTIDGRPLGGPSEPDATCSTAEIHP